MINRPGGTLATRPLHFIWICDCSGSMAGEKINQLNFAIKEALPAMRKEADENPNAQVFVRALKFSKGAEWISADPVPVEQFQWADLMAGGPTDMGKALAMVADALTIPPMTERALPPVLVLVSDGQPTDDLDTGLARLLEVPWGKKAVRLAIAIGKDADRDVLAKFIGNAEIPPFEANNAEALVRQVRWVSTVVLRAASSPAVAAAEDQPASNVPIPEIPIEFVTPSGEDDVW
jgi:uncharacterized protein YegL